MLTEKEKINFNELINNALNSFKNKQYTKAIKYAKQAIKLYPEEKISYEIIIHCYQALGQYRLVPKYETLMEDLSLPKGYWKDRAKSFKDIEIQLIENRNPKKLIQLANGYADRDKHKLALEYYLEAYKLDKKDSILLIKIGKLYEGHFFESDKANRYFTEAFLLNPKEETLEEDIFAFFLKTCKYEKGIAFYIKAYRSYPQKVALLKRVAFLYLLDNNIKSALQYYKKILKEEQFFDSYTVSQINSFFWESKMYSESLDFYKSLSKQSPENSDLVFQLAYWSIYIREDAKALDYFLKYYNSQIKEELANPLKDKLPILYQVYCDLESKFLPDGIFMFQEIEKYIKDSDAKIYIKSFIGKLYYKAENYEECIKLIQSILFEKYISAIFHHESGHPIFTLRKAYSKLKKNQESIDFHEDYLKRTKKYFKSEIIISLGDIYFENEEYKKAFNYYQQALKLEYANADQKGLFDEESRSMDETAKSLISLVDNWYEKKGFYFSYATYFIKKGLKLKSEDERFIYYFEKINNYSRGYRFNSYQTAFYAYENILEDAADNSRKFILAKLKNKFHKNKEAIDDLETLKENPTLKNKSDVLKLLGEIYREIGNHAEATKYFKEYQELSGDDSYEDFFLLDEKHQESVYNREYEIFLNTSFAHGLNYNEQNSLKGIAYEETTGQSEEAVIYIIYLIDSLKKDIKEKRFKKSEIFSILTLITFLYQRLFLLGKNLKMNAKKWEAYLLKTSEKYPDRSYLLENKRIKKIIKDVKEAEKNWKQYFLELSKKHPNELFNFQKQQIEVHEQASRRMEEAEKKLKTRFSNFDNLDLGSKELLISGEYIYKTLDASPKESDYSSVVAHYGRAIENELEKKLGLEGMLGPKQNLLIDRILEINKQDSELLKFIDKKELLKWNIFSKEYLGYSLNPAKNLNRDDKLLRNKNDFFDKIRNPRNAASHSGIDSFFNRTRADKVIKDMTDFLLQWTEVKFKTPENSASSN